jgi:Protein of unknown function (DUF3019)
MRNPIPAFTVSAALVFALALARPVAAADPEPVKFAVKPLLCVVDKAATSCMMSFDIRWKSVMANEYCLNDTARTDPVHCWARALNGAVLQERQVSEDFIYWLGAPGGVDHLAEVKVTVLRVGSDDRRRERRARHIWDVL